MTQPDPVAIDGPPNGTAYKRVRCGDCGREYICLPHDDYYIRPGGRLDFSGPVITGGVCEDCLLKGAGITKPIISADSN